MTKKLLYKNGIISFSTDIRELVNKPASQEFYREALSNLREIIGAVTGSIIFMFLQYKLESAIRSNIKESRKGLVKESPFTKFANWYIKPDSVE